jgi:hypothetical protein
MHRIDQGINFLTLESGEHGHLARQLAFGRNGGHREFDQWNMAAST